MTPITDLEKQNKKIHSAIEPESLYIYTTFEEVVFTIVVFFIIFIIPFYFSGVWKPQVWI
jgi:hypothetical protein